jgi:hypothetical protein
MVSFRGVRTCSIVSAEFWSQLARHRSLAGYVLRLRTSFGEMTRRSAKVALGKALAGRPVLISAVEAVRVFGVLMKGLMCLLLRREVRAVQSLPPLPVSEGPEGEGCSCSDSHQQGG